MQVTDIMSPRETTINSIDGTMQHTIDAGDSVEFEMYIENIGDADDRNGNFPNYLPRGRWRERTDC